MWDPAADVGEEEWRCFAYGDAVSFSTFGGAASQEPPLVAAGLQAKPLP